MDALDALYVLIGLVGFVAVVALVGVFALRIAIADVRGEAYIRNEWRVKDYDRLQGEVWALKDGMAALGMKLVPAEAKPARWVRSEPVDL
jgi:hypothetical protein